MRTFTTFDRPEGWPSAAEAFCGDFAAGARVQQAAWGGYAVLGHSELMRLARDPLADGMPPDPAQMAATPGLCRLLERSVFTRSGAAHRAERAALIAAFNAVPLEALVSRAVAEVMPETERPVRLKQDLIAPVLRGVWAGIIGLDGAEVLRLESAVREMSAALSGKADADIADRAEQATREVLALSTVRSGRASRFVTTLAERAGEEAARDLIAGMAIDAMEAAPTAVDAAMRVALRHRELVAPTARAASECLRLAGATPMTMRLTTGRIDLDGLVLEPGTVLSMVWAAGNHDPLAFPRPADFETDRTAARFLVFGMGQHACLGHAVVRTALIKLLGEVTRLWSDTAVLSPPWRPMAPDWLPELTVRIKL